jgi:hypothetical protein
VHIGGPGAKCVRERQQDPADLFGLLLFDRHDVVVDFDGAERLEVQTGAARRRAVDDARNGGAVLGADDEDVPAVSLGDDLVLQVLDVSRRYDSRVLRSRERCFSRSRIGPRSLRAVDPQSGRPIFLRMLDDCSRTTPRLYGRLGDRKRPVRASDEVARASSTEIEERRSASGLSGSSGHPRPPAQRGSAAGHPAPGAGDPR